MVYKPYSWRHNGMSLAWNSVPWCLVNLTKRPGYVTCEMCRCCSMRIHSADMDNFTSLPLQTIICKLLHVSGTGVTSVAVPLLDCRDKRKGKGKDFPDLHHEGTSSSNRRQIEVGGHCQVSAALFPQEQGTAWAPANVRKLWRTNRLRVF